VPLKWHFPIGLLYDLHCGASRHSLEDEPSKRPVAGSDDEDGGLPWRIELHFKDRPENVLVPLDADGKVLRDAFTNSVKEASFLRSGSGKVVMSLSKEDSTQLWDSVENSMDQAN
jgi:autophagy-related protein 5